MEQSAVTERPRLRPGSVIRDTYTVVELLGSGRFADAYLVRHRFMGMQVMKLLVDGLSDADRSEGLHEAFVLSKIGHERIIRVFDANHIDLKYGGHPYITMEYASGGTLKDLIASSSGGLQLETALDFGWQIADALSHAHRMDEPLVHRDIKPGNILFEPNTKLELEVRVADFGLATRVDRILNVVGSGGTILYMSPESLRGYETPASDVYSAGLVLYEMLVGTSPYPSHIFNGIDSSAGMQEALASQQREGFHPPSYFDQTIPCDVDSVVMRALRADDQLRFHDGQELAHAIMACQHVQRSLLQKEITDSYGQVLHDIFSLVASEENLCVAVDKLSQALDDHPILVESYLPHLRQLRIQSYRQMAGDS